MGAGGDWASFGFWSVQEMGGLFFVKGLLNPITALMTGLKGAYLLTSVRSDGVIPYLRIPANEAR
jgi:hypothetical protein